LLKEVSTPVILSVAKDLRTYFQRNTGMLRFAQHDSLTVYAAGFSPGVRELICPICNKHKAKRLCPAKAESICPSCCGREREVTIDCPSDCTYLIASREFGADRSEIDWSKVPFPDQRPSRELIHEHESFILDLSYEIGRFGLDNRSLVDSDVQVSLKALAESYRTLSSGIYFERPPDYRLQRELYDRIKEAIEEFKADERKGGAITSMRDSEIRDCLVLFAQIAVMRSNGRPKGRAFLDFLRSQFPIEAFSKLSSSSIVVP
jgi:hypothetical protein